MGGFTKLFSDIVMSTIWREDDKTRIVWITMLATADAQGRVNASVPGLADAARVGVDECRSALAKLSAPDPDSRTKDHEGRRIVEIDGGWLVLNYLKYRERRDPDKHREQVRDATRRYREKQQKPENVIQSDTCDTNVIRGDTQSYQAEAEAEATKENKDNSLSGSLSLNDDTCDTVIQSDTTHRMTPEQRDAYLEEARRGAAARQEAKKAAYDAVVEQRREIELAGVSNSAGPEPWEQG